MPHAAATVRNNGNAQPHLTNAKPHPNGANGVGRSVAATGFGSNGMGPHLYTYGAGKGARRYHAYGYGHGYRNRSSVGRCGRSQGNNRAVVSRLRSVHATLARLDHDYRGHRVRAMHAISMAIRQLSHRSLSTVSNGGFATTAVGRVRGTGRGGALANNAGARRTVHLTQAQSDSRMAHALRTTQGIHMQLGNQAQFSQRHYRARGYVARAVHELNTALAVR